MNAKILVVVLMATTLLAVAIYPNSFIFAKTTKVPRVQEAISTSENTQQNHLVDAVFVLDTTGSMGGLIEAAKQKIWSIASTMASSESGSSVRIGLVAYRDRGDAYVTKVIDLSSDLDSIYANLMDFKAQGGGDTPESVNQGLYDAVNKINWRKDSNAYKVIFLVGDAPAHMDYKGEMKFPEIIYQAKLKNIVINSIQCGDDQKTQRMWQEIAQVGAGAFFKVGQNGSAVAISTPMDKRIAELSAKLDDTRLFYGNEVEQKKQRLKVAATDKLKSKSSIEAQARRGVFNASKGGKTNFLGEKDLVEDLANGKSSLDSIKEAELPVALRKLSKSERVNAINNLREEREEIKAEISSLGEQRQAYIAKELASQGEGGASLDDQLYSTIKKQAAKKGIKYKAEKPQY